MVQQLRPPHVQYSTRLWFWLETIGATHHSVEYVVVPVFLFVVLPDVVQPYLLVNTNASGAKWYAPGRHRRAGGKTRHERERASTSDQI